MKEPKKYGPTEKELPKKSPEEIDAIIDQDPSNYKTIVIEKNEEENAGRNRTIGRVSEKTFPIPDTVTQITHMAYERAFTGGTADMACNENQLARLQDTDAERICLPSGLSVVPGKPYVLIMDGEKITADKLPDHYIDGINDEDDKVLLTVMFAIIKAAIEKSPETFVDKTSNALFHVGYVRIYLPDLIAKIYGKKQSSYASEELVRRLKRFESVTGIIEKTVNGETVHAPYPCLCIRYYDKNENTLVFESPYMAEIYSILFYDNMKHAKDKKAIKKREDAFRALPNYTSLIDAHLYGQTNKKAIALVQEIVLLIVHAGPRHGNTPNISVERLISRVPEIWEYIDDRSVPTRNKTKVLKRTFAATWEYLKKYTRLTEEYKTVTIPDFIPGATRKDLSKILYFGPKEYCLDQSEDWRMDELRAKILAQIEEEERKNPEKANAS